MQLQQIHFVIGIFLTLTYGARAEFLYPVAVFNGQDGCSQIYLIHQTLPERLKLWLWHPLTGVIKEGLLPTLTPASLQLAPDMSGFIFIDNGRIRFNNLTCNPHLTKTLALQAPLYDMTRIEWVNSSTFYLSAKKRDFYGIFQANLQGETLPLVVFSDRDCMYPQKVGNQLFYIERCLKDGFNYRIMLTDYGTAQVGVTLIDCDTIPIAFLQMVSPHEGFFISHLKVISAYEKGLSFVCHHLFFHHGSWQSAPLFSCIIPSQLLFADSDDRLYESMLPLLPRYYGDHIYFCSSSTPQLEGSRRRLQSLDIYSYSLATKAIEQKTWAGSGDFFFAPLKVGNSLYYGFMVSESEEEGQEKVIFTLPKIDL